MLPSGIMYRMIRSRIVIRPNLDDDIELKIADTLEELENALSLLNICYKEEGFIDPQSSFYELNKYQLLPTASIIIAKKGSKVVGTLTLVRRSSIGLPLEQVFDISNDAVDNEGCAEITCLAIDRQYRRQTGTDFLFPLMKYMYEYAINYFNVKKLFIACYPKDSHFYKALLEFTDISTNCYVADYKGAPAQALVLDLQMAYIKMQKTYKGAPLEQDLFQYFTVLKLPQFKYPDRTYHKIIDANWDRNSLDFLINHRNYKMSKLSESEAATLRNWYLENESGTFFRSKTDYIFKRKERRFESANPIFFSNIQIDTQLPSYSVRDISLNGMRIYSKYRFDESKTYEVQVEVAKDMYCILKMKLIWSSERESAFRITECDEQWRFYIEYLDNKSHKTNRHRKSA